MTKTRKHEYPWNVVKQVQEYYLENYDMDLTHNEIQKLPIEEVLIAYAEWNGIGWTYIDDIKQILRS